jgi:hypothetical protein
MTDDQVKATLRTRTPNVTAGQGRHVPDPSGLRLLELNMGSPVDGIRMASSAGP